MLLKLRIVLTVVVGMLYTAFGWLFGVAKSAWQAQAATGQLSDDPIVYGLSRTAATSQLVENVAGWILIATMLLIWAAPLWQWVKSLAKSGGLKMLVLLGLLAFATTGCVKPVMKEKFEEIKPNETAFLVPLEGAAKGGQMKFMSVEYLEVNKVPTKRVTLPQRETKVGLMWWEIQWIPTMTVIRVDRTPVSREWIQTSGGTTRNQALAVETVESIDFYIGVNCTALVQEDDASRFLYYFAGKSLSDVMDENIRQYVQSYLYREYGTRTLDNSRKDKKEIFDALLKDARAHFAEKGITIEVLGGSEGYTYKDPKIQDAINQIFTSAQAQTVAQNEKLAQDQRNLKDIEVAKTTATVKQTQADADAYVTKTTGQAQNDVMTLQGQTLQKYPELVSMEIARRSTGQVPSTLYLAGNNDLPFVVTLPQPTPR